MDIVDISYLSDYRLQLSFSDGTSGVADLADEIGSRRAFAPLRDLNLFRRAHLDGGTVAWPGGLDLASERLYALAHRLEAPATLEAARANELTVSIRELRRLSDVRQEDLAAMLEVTQGAVSKLESATGDTKIATLRRFVEALGWELEITAVKGDKRLRLRGV